MNTMLVVTGHARGEITEKKSRFIADVFEIHSEAQAVSLLESVRKQYYDARHHCYAFVLGKNSELKRFSDDREPQGTAGRPILDVLTGRGFCNTLIVVTRYFGGILLGTGGLTRAYAGAASEGLAKAQAQGMTGEVFPGCPVAVSCDYSASGKVQYLIGQEQIPLSDTVYDAAVTYQLVLPEEKADSFLKKITEATNASASIEKGAPGFYLLSGGRPVPYVF